MVLKSFLKILLLVILVQIVSCTSIKVSIIIPVYNTDQYLDRSLQSAINQTLKEIEIICIDDGSTDNTLDILKKYEKKDNRIKVIHFDENKGVAAARNKGMEIAKGEFIGFMDSDDYADKRFFENLYKHSDGYDIVYGRLVYGTNLSENYLKPKKHNWGVLYDIEPEKRGWGVVYDSLWKKSFITTNNVKHDVTMKKGSDAQFRKDVYKFKPKILDLPDEGIYYYYKKREGSIQDFKKENLEYIEKKAQSFEKEEEMKNFIKNELQNFSKKRLEEIAIEIKKKKYFNKKKYE